MPDKFETRETGTICFTHNEGKRDFISYESGKGNMPGTPWNNNRTAIAFNQTKYRIVRLKIFVRLIGILLVMMYLFGIINR